MANTTNHDTAYGSRTSGEPLQRTADRAAGQGVLGVNTSGQPMWKNMGQSAGTYHPSPTALGREDRRAAHGGT